MYANVQLKHKSLTEDQPNLVKSGSFQLQIVTELDAHDDPNHPIHNTNKTFRRDNYQE